MNKSKCLWHFILTYLENFFLLQLLLLRTVAFLFYHQRKHGSYFCGIALPSFQTKNQTAYTRDWFSQYLVFTFIFIIHHKFFLRIFFPLFVIYVNFGNTMAVKFLGLQILNYQNNYRFIHNLSNCIHFSWSRSLELESLFHSFL